MSILDSIISNTPAAAQIAAREAANPNARERQIFSLGSVKFHGFEVPDMMHFGGKQVNVVHEYIGGGRSIQTLGNQPMDIRWHGKLVPQTGFRTTQGGGVDNDPNLDNPIERMLQVEQLRINGEEVDFVFANLHWLVIIDEFDYDVKHISEIDYSICLKVVKFLDVTQHFGANDLQRKIAQLSQLSVSGLGVIDQLLNAVSDGGSGEILAVAGVQFIEAVKKGSLSISLIAGLVSADAIGGVLGHGLGLIQTANRVTRDATLIVELAKAVIK